MRLFDCLQNGLTPLHEACVKGHVEVVSELLKAGAMIEARERVSPLLSWLIELSLEWIDSFAPCL
jgi:ankyrin repeat protein